MGKGHLCKPPEIFSLYVVSTSSLFPSLLFGNKWRFPEIGGTPKSSICRWISHSKPSIGGTPISGNPHMETRSWWQKMLLKRDARHCSWRCIGIYLSAGGKAFALATWWLLNSSESQVPGSPIHPHPSPSPKISKVKFFHSEPVSFIPLDQTPFTLRGAAGQQSPCMGTSCRCGPNGFLVIESSMKNRNPAPAYVMLLGWSP